MAKGKKRKRANGEGSIFQGKDGRWYGKVAIGFYPNGSPKHKEFSRKTQKEVVELVRNYIAEQEQNSNDNNIEVKELTLGEWFDVWYEKYVVNKVKATTRAEDEHLIRNHLKPHIGKIKLTELKGRDIQNLYNRLLINGIITGRDYAKNSR